MTGLDRERAIEQPLRPAQPLLRPGVVVAVEELENERCGDASEAIDARRLDLERLLEQTAGVYHRCRRRWQVENRLAAPVEVDVVGAVRSFSRGSTDFVFRDQ